MLMDNKTHDGENLYVHSTTSGLKKYNLHMDSPDNDIGVVCVDVFNILLIGWNDKMRRVCFAVFI